MAPVGGFLALYGGAIAGGVSAVAAGYGAYTQQAAGRKARSQAGEIKVAQEKFAQAELAMRAKEFAELRRSVDVELAAAKTSVGKADIINMEDRRRRMASSASNSRATIRTSLAGLRDEAQVEKKSLLGG